MAPYSRVRCARAVLLALAACAPPARAAESVRIELRDAGNTPAAAVVLYLQGATPELAPAGTPHAIIDQRDKAFVPGYVVLQRGTAVEFPNHDTVSHHVYSFSDPNAFELPLYKGAPAKPVVFQRPGVVTLGCNIHDRMIAYVVVVETPYFGITAADGSLALPAVAPGRYQVMAWSPRLDPAKALPVDTVEISPGSAAATHAYRLARKLKPVPAAAASSLSWGDY